MLVTADDRQLVLPGESSDPQVVLRNRLSLAAKLGADFGVGRGRVGIDEQDRRARVQGFEELVESLAVPRGRQTLPVLADHDDGEMQPLLPREER